MTVSSANVAKKVRGTSKGWKLAALLPVLKKKKLPKEHRKNFTRIKQLLWHKCISLLTKNLPEKFATGESVKCGDGYVRTIKPVLAAWLGDRKESEVVCAAFSVSHCYVLSWMYIVLQFDTIYCHQGTCFTCDADKSELDDNEEHQIKDLHIMQALIRHSWDTGQYPEWNIREDEDGECNCSVYIVNVLPIIVIDDHLCVRAGVSFHDPSVRSAPFLDANGRILNDAAYKRAVGRLGHHVLTNATWVLPHFNCLVQVCAKCVGC